MGGQRFLNSVILMSILCFSNCTGTSPVLQPAERTQPDLFVLDHRDPLSVVEAVLYAADSGDIDVMCNLCDPRLMNDNKTEDLCFIAEQDIAGFRKKFTNACILGEIEFKSEYAYVTVSSKERSGSTVFVLVNRYGNWYLYMLE